MTSCNATIDEFTRIRRNIITTNRISIEYEAIFVHENPSPGLKLGVVEDYISYPFTRAHSVRKENEAIVFHDL